MKYNLTEMYVGEDVINAAVNVIRSKRYIKGPQAKVFEREFADYIGAKMAVSTSSGTTALWLIYDALGIKNNVEFITPSHTFIATVTPAMHMGARPVFVDIDEETYTINVEEISKEITPKTKAIVVYLIEDCAQAHGAMYYGKKAGPKAVEMIERAIKSAREKRPVRCE